MSASSQAAARRDQEIAEYGTASAIALLNPLLDEARSDAFTKQGSATVTRETGARGPASIDVDKNGDGKTDTKLTFARTGFGNLDKVTIDSNADNKTDGSATATRSLGRVQSTAVDANGDGKNDMKITVNRPFFGYPSIDVDTNGDGKADHKLLPDVSFFGTLRGLHVDLKADGTNDGYIKFERNGWGNIDKMTFRKKP